MKKISDEEFLNSLNPILEAPSIWEIAKRLNLTKSSVYDRLQTMIKKGRVKKIGEKYYCVPRKIEPILKLTSHLCIDGKWRLNDLPKEGDEEDEERKNFY